MTIVESRAVTGGVDTHLDTHVAAALDGIGGLLGVESEVVPLVVELEVVVPRLIPAGW